MEATELDATPKPKVREKARWESTNSLRSHPNLRSLVEFVVAYLLLELCQHDYSTPTRIEK